MSLTIVDLILPKAGDLDRSSGIVEFRTQYIARAKDIAEASQLGLGVAHSHPKGCSTAPSWLDNDMDRYFAEFLKPFLPDRPYASLIFEKGTDGTLSWSGRAFNSRGWVPVSDLLVTSDQKLTRLRNQLLSEAVDKSPAILRSPSTARANELFGEVASERIRGACVGVIGASGTGSPAIEILARAGVGEIIVVDPKRLDFPNQERVHGSCAADYRLEPLPWKVDVAERHVQAIAPATKITKIVGNILENRVLDELLRCDVLLGCSDTHHSRAAYSYLANHYYLPVLDMGVRMHASEGKLRVQAAEIIAYWPGGPCPYCDERIDWREVSQELARPEEAAERQKQAEEARADGFDGDQYWRDSSRLLTVGYLTTAVGSLAAGYTLHWLTGTAEMPASRFQIDVGFPNLGFVSPPRKIKPGCVCRSKFGWSDQATSERLVGY
jgi:molybdopterin/thiamine biosynthesis adenylyltransferase